MIFKGKSGLEGCRLLKHAPRDTTYKLRADMSADIYYTACQTRLFGLNIFRETLEEFEMAAEQGSLGFWEQLTERPDGHIRTNYRHL